MLRVRSLDLAVSAILFLFGFYVGAQGAGYGFLDAGTPDAGFFPVLIGFGISAFSGINFYNVMRRSGAVSGIITREEVLRAVLASLALVAFTALAAPMGMLPAGFLLMMAISVIFGARTPRMIARAALASALMSGVLYLIFVKFLAIVLP